MSRFGDLIVERPEAKAPGFSPIDEGASAEYLMALTECEMRRNQEGTVFIRVQGQILESDGDEPVGSYRTIFLYSNSISYKTLVPKFIAALNGGTLPNDADGQDELFSKYIAYNVEGNVEDPAKCAGTLFVYNLDGKRSKNNRVYARKTFHAARDSDYIRHEDAVAELAS